MPIYEYKCENGHVFDVMQKMSEDPLRECVECGAPVKKLMHPVSISFKGSGFYSTDYKNGKSSTDKTDTKSTETEKAKSGSDTSTNGDKKSGGSDSASSGSSTEKAKKD